jgi:cobalt/nickel transport system permease protein
MGILGPLVGWLVFIASRKVNLNMNLAVFLTAAVADLATYVVTSIQLAVAFPAATGGVLTSFKAFFVIFAVTQVPLAIVEGLVTVVIFKYLVELRSDLLVHMNVIKPAEEVSTE